MKIMYARVDVVIFALVDGNLTAATHQTYVSNVVFLY